jgi:hypothetical protein
MRQVPHPVEAGGYGHASSPVRLPTLRLPRVPMSTSLRALPSAPAEFSSVYTRRSRNRYGSGQGLPQIPTSARERDNALSDTQSLASHKWREQLSDRTHNRRRQGGKSQDNMGPQAPAWKTQKWRENFALKEGRVIQDQQFWDNVKAKRKDHGTRTSRPLAGDHGELAAWKNKIQPWDEQRRVPKVTYNQRRLVKMRKEHAEMLQRGSLQVLEYFYKGKKLLKDMQFLVEKKLESIEFTDPDFAQLSLDANNLTKGMEKLLAERRISMAQYNEMVECHRVMLKDLFIEMDDDGSCLLERDEISALVARLGQKLTPKELNLAMTSMDEDGSGEVDFGEFYEWFTSDKSSAIKQSGDDDALFEIVRFES